MKIECRCGALIVDQTDELPHKAYIIPDQEWFAVLEAIDEVARPDLLPEAREAARQAARSILWRVSRIAWQCRECGRLYLDEPDADLFEFLPVTPDTPHELFRSRPSADPPS